MRIDLSHLEEINEIETRQRILSRYPKTPEIHRAELIAQEVRFRIALYAERYHPYISETLAGLCEYASRELAIELRKEGYHRVYLCSGTYLEVGHFWVRVGDWVIDITASQFSYPDIYIVHSRECPYSLENIFEIREEAPCQ